MKAIILTIGTILTLSATAQTNPITTGIEGFENWTTNSVGEMPVAWDGFNRQVMFGGMTVGEVECIRKDSLDPKEGNFSISLTSESVMGGPAVPALFTTGDLIIDWNAQNGDITGGEAFTNTPTQLKGWYKYYPVNNDTAFIEVDFTQNSTQVGSGRIELSGSTQDWTPFVFDITFDNRTMPDSMNIVAASTKASENIPVGTVLELDAMEFVYGTTGLENKASESIKVYPNPATNNLTIDGMQTGQNNITIFNSLGQTIENLETSSHSILLNVSQLKTGIYFVQIENNEHKEVRKIQVK